jgi:hypothetical protein
MIVILPTIPTSRPGSIGARYTLRDLFATTGRRVPYGPGDSVGKV